jgi:hypothetical protein
MRTFFPRIVTALLGLGSALSGVIAAPTGLAGLSKRDQLEARATKQVPDIKASPYLYTVIENAGLASLPSTYTVSRKENGAHLDLIKVDRKTASIIVEDANNDSGLRTNRIPLRDIAMYLYTNKSPKQEPLTLKKITFAPVVEPVNTNQAIIDAKAQLGKQTFKVMRASTGPEKKVYDDLMSTVFGRSVAHYRADYGLNVAAVEVTGTKLVFELEFHMQPKPPAPSPPPKPSPAPKPAPAPAPPKKPNPAPPTPPKKPDHLKGHPPN